VRRRESLEGGALLGHEQEVLAEHVQPSPEEPLEVLRRPDV
jgi:hypothetical protein